MAFKIFGHDDCVFIRPTNGNKLFVGRCVSRDEFAPSLAMTRYDPTTMIVIAQPRLITREWRVVVVNNSVVSGGQYAEHGVRSISAEFPMAVRIFAKSILAEVHWCPDPEFTMDIGESEGKLWLIELNSFSSSWFCQADLSSVVAATSELVLRNEIDVPVELLTGTQKGQAMAKATTAELIRDWLGRVCAVERPRAGVVAFNIGLYEARRGYTAYLIGASTYDENNGDWACRVTFRPRESDRPLATREHADWEQALAAVTAAVRDFLATTEGQASFLGQSVAVTVGFDDGDLVRVH